MTTLLDVNHNSYNSNGHVVYCVTLCNYSQFTENSNVRSKLYNELMAGNTLVCSNVYLGDYVTSSIYGTIQRI